ncbi:hypothetical protein AYO38_07070 [bacterium SCGC AG-212-C10]|nr:hypothetical protein AYO38_07070 [bacterium SCGC AG-212-C10]
MKFIGSKCVSEISGCAEIDQLWTLASHDDVLWLHVAVHDSLRVGFRKGVGQSLAQLANSAFWQHASLLQHLTQGLTFGQLHDQKFAILVDSGIQQPDNVGMIEGAESSRFLLQLSKSAFAAGASNLHRYHGIGVVVVCPPHLREAAATQACAEFVPPT